MRFPFDIAILLIAAAWPAGADQTDYQATVRMHESPFAPDTHAPADKEKAPSPAIRPKSLAPARPLSSSPLDIPLSMPPPGTSEKSKEQDRTKQENWITPSSQATRGKEEPQPSGWGWLADEASRKLREKEQQSEEPGTEEDDDQSAWRKEDESRSDPGYFINNDYFNNASLFDTASQFDVKDEEKDSADTRTGGGDKIKPVVDDQTLASIRKDSQDMTETAPNEQPRTPGFASAPPETGGQSPEDHIAVSDHGFGAGFEAPRDTRPALTFSAAALAPQQEPAAIRIPLPADSSPAAFGSLTKPASSYSELSTVNLPGAAPRVESPLGRPAFEQPRSFTPAAAATPISGGIPAPSSASSIQRLYDSREEAGMRLLPR